MQFPAAAGTRASRHDPPGMTSMRRASQRPRTGLRPSLERLDDRTLLSVTVRIDYSLDTRNFFNTQARRDLLQAAADTVASRLADALDAITPGAGNTWTAT